MVDFPPDLSHILAHWASTLGCVTGIQPLSPKDNVWDIHTASGTRYVLKAVTTTAFSDHISSRLDLLRYLQAQGVPVAAPVPLDGAPQAFLAGEGGQQYWLSPHLPDGSGWEGPVNMVRLYENTGAAIARLHRALGGYRGQVHSWRLDLVHDTLRVDLPLLREYLPAEDWLKLERAATFLAQRLPGRLPGLPAQTIHGDCHGGNILWEGERVSGFIDLDHLPWGPRVYDLGYFLADMAKNRIYQPDEIAAWFGGLGSFIRGYQAELPLTDAEITILPAIMLATQVRFAAWFARKRDPQRVRFNLDALYWLDSQAGQILRALET